MEHPYIEYLRLLAKKKKGRIALPDAALDERVLRAGCSVHQSGALRVVLTGSRNKIVKLAQDSKLDISGMELLDPDEYTRFGEMCGEYGSIRAKENLSSEQIENLLHEPVYFACMLHRFGIVEGVCSGVYYSTADLARASIKTLGMKPGFQKMTAMGVLVFTDTPVGDNLILACADHTIIPRPDSNELAEIAILAADKAKSILPESPRVAMISFSTTGSASHSEVLRVVTALKLVQQRRPDICIDGEFQLDTALSPEVARIKLKRSSEVAGRANVLIWPDLQTGNVAAKALVMMGRGMTVGSTFLGLNGLVGDHSRGATREEIVNYILFVGAQVDRN